MLRHRLVLVLATGLSLLLHLAVLGGERLTLPRLVLPDDDVLASRPATRVQRVRLLRTPASPAPADTPVAVTTPARVASAEEAAGTAPVPPPPATPEPAIAQPTPAAPVAPEVTPPARLAAPEAPPAPAEPAPSFPVQLSAQLEARLGSHAGLLLQTWQMEGLRYAIEVRAERPALALQLSSEGVVHPEGGLTPARSALLLRNRLHSLTEYAPGHITLGRPSRRQRYPLPVVPQDLASLPFQLAVTFAGQPQTIFVSSGTSLHQVRFTLVAEETLRLPGGTVKTLHLTGEQFHHGLGQMVQAYDIWLAPDFLNFPVKVRGHLPDGTPFDYRVLALDIEGRRVLGPLLAGAAPAPDRRDGGPGEAPAVK